MMADKFTDFQKRVEGVLDDIVEYYENGTDAADDVIQWAKDWAAQREIDWLEIKAGKLLSIVLDIALAVNYDKGRRETWANWQS